MSNHTLGHYCFTLKLERNLDIGVVNKTLVSLSHDVEDFWKSPRGTVTRIEALVVLATAILIFMTIFGSQRRRSRNFLIQHGVMGAYTLSFSLVSYTLGSMQSSAVKSTMYPIWTVSLFILYGCAESITAYNINDNDQSMRQMYQICLLYAYAALIVVTIGGGFLPLFILVIIGLVKHIHQFFACAMAAGSWNLNKMVSDYMYWEHTKSGASYNPSSMKGYNYLVDWRLRESKLGADTSYTRNITENADVIDIERIWLCQDRSLIQELKDTCLSFSLFHLLRRRFFGFECGEASLQKTRDFVFEGLLSKNVDGAIDYNRVFKVMEVELAFMYDFYFTKRAVLYYGSGRAVYWSIASASLIALVAFMTTWPTAVMKHNVKSQIIFLDNRTVDIIITVLILASIALLEVLQQLLYFTSIWGRVAFVCQHIKEPATNAWGRCRMRFKETMTQIGFRVSDKYYWEEKLGQYSLLESLRCTPILPATIEYARKRFGWISKYFHLIDNTTLFPFDAPHAPSVCGKKWKHIKLTEKVKDMLLQSLDRTQGNLTNGQSSLESNEAFHLLWACRLGIHLGPLTSCSRKKENQVHVILTWHIATCYCELGTLNYLCPHVGSKLKSDFDVATTLSKYCAYLLVSARKLLPGHHYDTRDVLFVVADEALHYLKDAKDMHETMRSLPESTDRVFLRGVKLGKQLEGMKPEKRWKVLAEFWAEMVIFVAPSDNVKAHIKCLTQGGELVTHLWALLTHAGILDRGPRNVSNVENTKAEQPYTEWASSLDKCTEGAAPVTCGINQLATSENHVQSLEICVEGGRNATNGQSGGNGQAHQFATS